MVDNQLFGTTSAEEVVLDILKHNSFLLGGKLSTLFVSSLALVYLSKQNWFLSFIDTYWKYPDIIKNVMIYIIFILILSSSTAPLSQGILMWKDVNNIPRVGDKVLLKDDDIYNDLVVVKEVVWMSEEEVNVYVSLDAPKKVV